jgi:glycerophosphoryl diester phosphodiesterase
MFEEIGGPPVGSSACAPIASTAMPKIIAHRGASAGAPENTRSAFQLAWAEGADGIEIDVRLSADGRIVAIHDADTVRVSGTRLIVTDTTYDEMKTLDVGSWLGPAWRGEKIPLLQDVLADIPAGKLAFIELKTGPQIIGPLADILARSPLAAEQIVLMSFDVVVVTACKKILPQIACNWLTSYKQESQGSWTPSADDVITTLRSTGADALGTENRPKCVNEEFVRRLRAAQFERFHVWTVDDPDEARHYRWLGATSITTNRPAELRRAMTLPMGQG